MSQTPFGLRYRSPREPFLRYLRTVGTAISGRSFDKLWTIGRSPFDTSGRTGEDGLRRRTLVVASSAAALGACAVAPNQPGGSSLRIGVASCADQDKPQPIWDAALQQRCGYFVFAGDNVYASEPPFSIDKLRRAYADLAAKSNFQTLRNTTPHLAVWDDHDYGVNDGGAEFAQKQASKDEFLRFWRVSADDPRRLREGLYHAQTIERGGRRVQIIGLDTRWFRSPLKATDERGAPGKERYMPDADPTKTMLGDAQWRWLEAQLRERADVRVLVSSIQCVVVGHGFERWGNLPAERERLYRLIRDTQARGLIIVSGDRHIGGLYREANATLPYPLYELTSSGITHPWATAKEAGPNRIDPLVTVLHYGVVDIDFAARRLALVLRGLDNHVLHSHTITFEELRIA
jgi:alkaline phosphatase D